MCLASQKAWKANNHEEIENQEDKTINSLVSLKNKVSLPFSFCDTFTESLDKSSSRNNERGHFLFSSNRSKSIDYGEDM